MSDMDDSLNVVLPLAMNIGELVGRGCRRKKRLLLVLLVLLL
jgi:hypothetical protein